MARDSRRFYWELRDPEQAIVEYALSERFFDRSDVVERFNDHFSDKKLDDAFTSLKEEDRLFRRGNQSEYIMVERDLF